MTPQFIMRAGIGRYLQGLKDGQGNYVRRTPTTMDTPYWDTLEWHRQRAVAEVENLDWYAGYAGQSDTGAGVLVADWNNVHRDAMRLLEQAGYTLDWSDEVTRCEDCNRAAHITPQCYGDLSTAVYIEDVGEFCRDCAVRNHAEELVADCINTPRRAVKYPDLDLEALGFTKLNAESYESGFHPGQNDDPRAIYTAIRESDPESEIVFQLNGAGQFDISFSVWSRPANWQDAGTCDRDDRPAFVSALVGDTAYENLCRKCWALALGQRSKLL